MRIVCARIIFARFHGDDSNSCFVALMSAVAPETPLLHVMDDYKSVSCFLGNFHIVRSLSFSILGKCNRWTSHITCNF